MSEIAVVIPTYNRSSLLKRALDSVERQTYKDFEIIVVDDGSEDDTASVVQQYATCRYINIEHSGLPAVARNAGIRATDAKLVAFLDSDDEWQAHKLETQMGIINAASCGLICSNALVTSDNGGPGAVPYLRPGQGHTDSVLKDLLADNFVITSTAMVRRDFLDRAGGFCEDPALCGLEDYDLWLRLAAISEVHYLPQQLVFYRRSVTSLSRQRSELSYWKSMDLIYSRMAAVVESGDRAMMAMLNRQSDACKRAICNEYLAADRLGDFAKSFAAFCSSRPLAAAEYLAVRMTRHQRSPIRIHLGCGERYLSGYINVDLPASSHTVQKPERIDLYADISHVAFSRNSVDEIRLHHVFEHFTRPAAVRLLIEWYGWMKLGGKLVIETPDIEASLRRFQATSDLGLQSRILRHLCGSHEADWAVHKDSWYRGKFERHLNALGFGNLGFEYSEWNSLNNITVTATKVSPERTPEELFSAGEDLLRLSMVDNSETEQRIFEVWRRELRGRQQNEDPSHG